MDEVPQNFPGIAETEVFIPSLGKSVKVRPNQVPENVPQLPRDEYRRAAAIQKQRDAEYEAAKSRGLEAPILTNDVKRFQPPPIPGRQVPVPPDGAPKKRRRRWSPTTGQLSPIPTLLEDRVASLESGIAAILLALQQPKDPPESTQEYPVPKLVSAMMGDEEDDEFEGTEQVNESDHPYAVEGDETTEEFNDEIPEQRPISPQLAEVVRMIQTKRPFRVFRQMVVRLLGNICGVQNWPEAHQKAVEQTFTTILYDQGFLEGVSNQVRTFQNGAVVGSTILFNYAVLLAGCSAVLLQIPRKAGR